MPSNLATAVGLLRTSLGAVTELSNLEVSLWGEGFHDEDSFLGVSGTVSYNRLHATHPTGSRAVVDVAIAAPTAALSDPNDPIGSMSGIIDAVTTKLETDNTAGTFSAGLAGLTVFIEGFDMGMAADRYTITFRVVLDGFHTF